MKKRHNKSTSFKLTDAFEKRLLEFATSADKGDYSKYIKRLITRDMEGVARPQVAMVQEVTKVKRDFGGFI